MNGFLTSVNFLFLLISSKNSARFSPFRRTGESDFQIQTILALIGFFFFWSISAFDLLHKLFRRENKK